MMHPSRQQALQQPQQFSTQQQQPSRGRGRGRGGGGGSTQPPPDRRAIYLASTLYPDSRAPLVIGDRATFNNVRIQLLLAATRLLMTLPMDQQRPLRHELWIESPQQISFNDLPVVHDADAMAVLASCGMIGVYWLVNHADTRGSLSCGQVYDLLISLDKLSGYGLENGINWPRGLFAALVRFLQACVDEASGVTFNFGEPPPPPPPPSSAVKQPHPKPKPSSVYEPSHMQPNPPFAYAAADQPASVVDAASIGKALDSLKHLVPPKYDPSNPSL